MSGSNIKLRIIDSYDLLSIRPSQTDSNLFEQVCTKTDCDIISLDLGSKLQFYLTKAPIKQAIQRGAVFEICYGQGLMENHLKNRKVFLNNCLTLVKLTKGKSIIFGSEANKRIFMRSPLDVQTISHLFAPSSSIG